MNQFNYDIAFSRNIGWLTKSEQKTIQSKKIAIAGMGGVGGVHLLTLCRLGVGHFHIADFDCFDVGNFNRQAGAFMSTLNQPKADVMKKMALDINPEIGLKSFDQGVTDENIDAFLEGVDLYVDGLDFFVLDMRAKVFQAAYEKGIPCISVAPIGMGAALINVLPNKMSFEDYFGFKEAKNDFEKALRFAIGLAPKIPHRKYLADEDGFDFKTLKAPSTPMGCQLASGVMGTEVLKILLGRGKVYALPHTLQFDAYNNNYYRSWLSWGHKNWFHKLKFTVVKQYYTKKVSASLTAGGV